MRATHAHENRLSANCALIVVEQNIARLIKLRSNPVRAAMIGVVFDNQITIGRFISSRLAAASRPVRRAPR